MWKSVYTNILLSIYFRRLVKIVFLALDKGLILPFILSTGSLYIGEGEMIGGMNQCG